MLKTSLSLAALVAMPTERQQGVFVRMFLTVFRNLSDARPVEPSTDEQYTSLQLPVAGVKPLRSIHGRASTQLCFSRQTRAEDEKGEPEAGRSLVDLEKWKLCKHFHHQTSVGCSINICTKEMLFVVVVFIGFELELLRQGAAAMLVRSLPKKSSKSLARDVLL